MKPTFLVLSLSVLFLAGCQSAKTMSTEEALSDPVAMMEPADASVAPLALADTKMMRAAPIVAEYNGYRKKLDHKPPVQNTEQYAKHEPNPVQSVATNPISTFSVDVDTGSYANVRRFLKGATRLPPAAAVRHEEMINYFNYNYPQPKDGKPFVVHTVLTDSPFKDNAKLLKIAIKGKETTKETLPPANLVFLVDVSGSMDSNDKLPLVKSTLRMLTKQLRETDSISIITYASGEKLELPATYATEQGKEKILQVISSLNAGGSTAGEQAIQLAYAEATKHFKVNGINRILLMTDGDFNVGITDFDTLKDMVAQKRKSGVSLSTFGFGTGNYNERLMEQMADAGDGNYSYIDSEQEAKKVLSRQLTSTLATIAQDVKVQVEFNPKTVREYRLIGYENRQLNESDFKNDNVDAGDIGAGHGVTALYEVIPVGVEGYLSDKRYADTPKKSTSNNQEYAHVAIRYKLPNQPTSQELTQVVSPKSYTPFKNADSDTKFAVAVAGFAELLRGGQYAGSLRYEDIITLAKANKGADTDGTKEEFVEMVEIAKSLNPKPPKTE